MKCNHLRTGTLLCAVALTAAFTGCGKLTTSEEIAADTSVKISGAFGSVTSRVGRISPSLARSILDDSIGMASVSIPLGYKIYCVTFTSPPLANEGNINANGSFEVTVAGAKGKKMGCFVVDGDGEKKATLVIKDTSQKTLDGKDKTSDSAAFDGNASLGTSLALDLVKGEIVVDIADIKKEGTTESAIAAAAPAATAATTLGDFSGDYKIAQIDFTPPTGYQGPGPEGCSEGCGPVINMPLFVKRITATMNADSSTIYGLQVWEGVKAEAESRCGKYVGMSASEATANGITFPSNTTQTAGAFVFADQYTASFDTICGGGASATCGIVGGWKLENAKLKWDIHPSCGPYSMVIDGKTVNAWKCTDNSGDYQVNIGGGCVITGTSTPVQPTDWTNITTCPPPVDSTANPGFKISSCSGTSIPVQGGGTQNVTCFNEFAFFDATGPTDGSTYSWTEVDATKIASGQLCSGLPGDINKLKCYADAYYDHKNDLENSGGCLPEVRTNWTTTDPTQFARVDHKPKGLIFFEKLDFGADGSASFRTEDEEFRGVQAGNAWIPCQVRNAGSGVITRVSDTKLLMTFQEVQKTTSSDEACLARFPGEAKNFMFYLIKQ